MLNLSIAKWDGRTLKVSVGYILNVSLVQSCLFRIQKFIALTESVLICYQNIKQMRCCRDFFFGKTDGLYIFFCSYAKLSAKVYFQLLLEAISLRI